MEMFNVNGKEFYEKLDAMGYAKIASSMYSEKTFNVSFGDTQLASFKQGRKI